MATFATIGFKFDTTGLKQAERGMDSMAAKGERSEKRINKSVDSMNTGFKSMRSTIGLATAALTAFGSARISQEIIKQSDAWKNINSQIRQVTESEKELIGVRKQLVDLSKDTRSELTNTVDLYAQLTRSTKDLGTTQEEVLNVTKTLNNLFVAGGKPISEVSGAIRQLSQGFAAGALRGDEFNSVAEGAPKIMDALAVKLKMTRGELREFAATGGITAQIMVDALKDYEDVAQRLADQTTKTFGQSMENANTNLTEFIGQLESVNQAVDFAGQSIEDMTGQLGSFAKELELWSSQFDPLAENIEQTMSQSGNTFRQEIIAMGAITDETINFITDAIMHFPTNIRSLIEIMAVNLGAGVDIVSQFGVSLINTIVANMASLIDVVKIRIGAFGDVLGTELAVIVKKAEIYGKQIRDAINPFDGDTFDHEKALKEAEQLGKDLTNEYLSQADAQVKAAKDAARGVTDAAIESFIQRKAISLNAAQTVISDVLRTRDEQIAAYESLRNKAEEVSNAITHSSKKSGREVRNETEKTTSLVNESMVLMEESIKRLDETFIDVWMGVFDGFDSVKDKLLNSFKQMLAEMAHAALTRPIVLQIGTALGLGGASGVANAASGLGSLGNLGGILSSLSGAATTMGLAAQSVTGLLMQGNIGGAFSTVGGAIGAGSFSSAIGAALPIAGIAAAALAITDKIAGGGLFGTSYKAKDTTLNLGYSGGDTTGSTTLLETKKRSLFRGTKRRETTTGLDLSAVDDIFDSVQSSILEAAELLDITEVTKTIRVGFKGMSNKFTDEFERYFDTASVTTTQTVEEYLNSFSASFSKSIKDMSEEEVQQAISDWTTRTTEQMINAVFGGMVDEFKKEGESSSQTIDRLIVNLKSIGAVTDVLGLSFELTGKEAAKASTNIVELVGGLDSLNALTTAYYNDFYTQQEKLASLTGDLTSAFDELNINMPQTREGFKALVESLDLTTQSGQEMFAMLMQLVPGMDQYFDAIQEGQTNAIDAAMSALNESISLEKQRANVIVQSARDAYSATIAGIEAQRTAVLNQQSAAQDTLNEARTALDAAFSNRTSSLQSIVASMSSLAGRLSSLAGSSNNDIAGALDAARRGDFRQAQSLSGQLPSGSQFSTAADFRVAQATAKNQLQELSNLASGRASGAQAQINALERQYNELVGVNTNVLSMSEAIEQYQDAQLALDALNTDETLAELSKQEEAAMALLDIAEQNYIDEINRLDGILESAQAQLDVLNGISENTLTASQALDALIAVISVAQERENSNNTALDSPTGGDNPTVEDSEILRTISKNMAKTARMLEDMTIDGLDTRVVS